MSDQKSSFGEPVDEPKDAETDVVGRAHEGLADAEAAKRDAREPAAHDEAAGVPAGAAPDHAVDRDPAEQSETVVTPSEPVTAPSGDRTTDAEPGTTPWYERQDEDEARWAAYAASADAPETSSADRAADTDRTVAGDRTDADGTPTVVAAPAATSAAPAAESNPAVFPAGQPIFVQAPEAPTPRGNRGAAGAIGLLAAVAFAVLYLGATLAVDFFFGDLRADGFVDAVVAAVTSWALWVPVVVFFIAFWLLGSLINRGRWGHWVVWGLLVGVASWAGHILGQLFEAPFWILTAREGADLVAAQVVAPLAIVAFVLGRELTIWFGAWVAARGKRMTELNLEALREYERTLEAGPQLHRA